MLKKIDVLGGTFKMNNRLIHETEDLEIRFLQSGLIHTTKPKGFDEWNTSERVEWADKVLGDKSDQELIDATYTLDPTSADLHSTGVVFDEAPQVAAIESKHGEEILHTTDEWTAFTGRASKDVFVVEQYDVWFNKKYATFGAFLNKEDAEEEMLEGFEKLYSGFKEDVTENGESQWLTEEFEFGVNIRKIALDTFGEV